MQLILGMFWNKEVYSSRHLAVLKHICGQASMVSLYHIDTLESTSLDERDEKFKVETIIAC